MGVKARYSFSVQAGWGANDDYWSEDFDNNKNCEQEKKIIELNKEVGAHAKIVLCSSQASRNYLTILQANDNMQGDGTGPGQCSIVPVFTHKNSSQSGQFLYKEILRWKMIMTGRDLSKPANRTCTNRLGSIH